MPNRRLPRIFGYKGAFPETSGTEGTSSEKLVGKHTHEEAYALQVSNSGRGLTSDNPFTSFSQPGDDNVENGIYYFQTSVSTVQAYVDGTGTYTSDSTNHWVLYQSFGADNALTSSNAPGLNGNRILINQGGWNDVSWGYYEDGNSGNLAGYTRGTGFVAFFRSGAETCYWDGTIPFTTEITATRYYLATRAGTDSYLYHKNSSGGFVSVQSGIAASNTWYTKGSPNNHLVGGPHIRLFEGNGSIAAIGQIWVR